MSLARMLAVIVAAALTFAAHDVSAQTLSKCSAGKKKCVSKKVAGLLKCHQKAEKKGVVLDTQCVQKVKDKFDGGTNPAKGCFAKLEAKNQNCLTFGDMTSMENQVDAFVLQIVCQLDPFFPCPVPTASPTCPPPAMPTPTPTSTPACMPMAEVCNGMDDDCNMMIDDGLPPITCGVGVCQNTVPSCSGGMPNTCTPNMPTGPETCNGMDDNCNGSTDEGLPPITCGMGACQQTVPSCVMGNPQTCTPGPPSAEVCNLIDDDCDGQVDEGNITCGVGACMNTVPMCVSGMNNTCTPGTPAPNEICANMIDDDCDGAVNEMPCI